MGLLNDVRTLVSAKARELQSRTGTPSTKVDSGGSIGSFSFDGQEIDRSKLREVREVRESGGAVAHLVHAKALMQFGTGVDFTSEQEEVAEWLNDTLNDRDNLLIELGEDAIWYPFSLAEIVETKSGGFSHIEPIEPWTMLPKTNDRGEIVYWEQEIRGTGTRSVERFETDEIASFILNKSCARDKTGISEVVRAEEEIENYHKNGRAINNAIEIAAYPHHIWQVGREGGAVIDDNELRRLRNRIDNMRGDTQFVMGRDIEHELIEPTNFEFEKITEHDLRKLALALGLPLELANVGSDGLGSGMPADLRLQLFERQARAAQRSIADQFVQGIVRPILEQYSPYPKDVNVEVEFGDPISDRSETAQWIDQIGGNLTLNEKRQELGYDPVDDEELGESFRKPANIQAPEEEEPEDGGGLPFLSERALSQYEDFEETYLQLWGRIWQEETDRNLLEFSDSQVPESVKDEMRNAINQGAIFSEFEYIPSSKLMQLRSYLLEELQDDRWNIDGIADTLMQLSDEMTRERAEVVARTETSAIVNKARQNAYEERGAEDSLFYWTGTSDSRTTEACEWLKEQTNPNHGGDPVSLERLKELIQEAPSHDPDMDDNLAREFIVHPNERHTWVRAPDASFDASLSSPPERQLETYDDYPEAAQENARMALDARDETGNPNDCGTRVGWERANQLDNGESLSEETISRMAAFERHEDNAEQGEEGRADCGWMMWKAWGGKEGIEWAQDKLDEIENDSQN